MEGQLIIFSSLMGGAGAWLMARFAPAFGMMDLPNGRSSHSIPTPRGGGIGILIAFVAAASGLGFSPAFWLPIALLSMASFFDDRVELCFRVRISLQFLAATVCLFAMGFPAMPPVFLLPLMVFWILFLVGTANFFNFLDGINGIAAVSAVIGFGLMAVYEYFSGGLTPFFVLFLSLAAACLGFLPFNFPRARVFMGDVGSILLGFISAASIIKLSLGWREFFCLLTFFFPLYTDTLSTLYFRWRRGENLVKAHRSHFYQVLVHGHGWTHLRVTFIFGLLQATIGGIGLTAYRFGAEALILFLFLAVLFLTWIWVVSRVHGLLSAEVYGMSDSERYPVN